MGKETRNFRQTKKARSADINTRNYAQINRMGNWNKIINIFKKGGEYKPT